MLNIQVVQLLITGGVVGIVLGSIPTIAYFTKKGVNIPKALDTADKTISAIEPVIDVAKEIAPLNPVINVAEVIKEWAKTGVKNAEQLYYTSQLTNNDDRKEAAKSTIYSALKEYNIVPTENQQKLIDDTIQAAVQDLGHSPADIKQLQDTNTQLQVQNAQLQTQNNELQTSFVSVQQENAQLNQKLNNVQTAIQ